MLRERKERDISIKQQTSQAISYERLYIIGIYVYSISARTNLFYLYRKLISKNLFSEDLKKWFYFKKKTIYRYCVYNVKNIFWPLLEIRTRIHGDHLWSEDRLKRKKKQSFELLDKNIGINMLEVFFLEISVNSISQSILSLFQQLFCLILKKNSQTISSLDLRLE